MDQAASHQEPHLGELVHRLHVGHAVSKATFQETVLEDAHEDPEDEDAAEVEEASSELIDSRETESMNPRGKGNNSMKTNHGTKMGSRMIRETS